MTKEITYGTIIFATLMGLIVGFFVMVILDSYTSKKRKRIYVAIIALTFILVMQNFIEYYLIAYTKQRLLRTCFAVLGYSIRPAIIVLFAYLFRPDRKHLIAWGLVIFNALMHFTAFIPKIVIVFAIDERNVYVGGRFYALCYVISFILLAYLAGLCFWNYKGKKFNIKDVIFHFFWIGITILGIISDMLWGSDKQWISYVTISIVIAVVYSYIWLHQHFVADYEADLLAEQRIRVMQKQIQPHFIYNTLFAIRSIEGNPKETVQAINEFSAYLRANFTALEGEAIIPFDRELETVKDYVALQRLRFADRFSMKYDINDSEFSLPPLTVQILVENAIKHGITSRYKKGTITVSSYKEKDEHVIKVEDDGVGFDVGTLKDNKGVGLRAVKNRLEYFLNAALVVESEKGKGTIVTIRIPEAADTSVQKKVKKPKIKEKTL